MSVSGTNQSKNIVTPRGALKAGIYTWGDAIGTWGDALATWGNTAIAVVNQAKSSVISYIELQDGSPLLLQNSTLLDLQSGSGGAVFINQSKS